MQAATELQSASGMTHAINGWSRIVASLQCSAGVVALTSMLAIQPAEAQRAGRSTPLVTLGAVAGGALGLVAGGLIGASITERGCEPGNPDACLGEAFPGFVWGAGTGMTLGIPVGAHLANNRAGSFAKTLGVSALLFGAEVLALNALVEDGRTEHRSLTFGIAAVTPLLQIGASVLMERSESSRR